MTIMTMMLMVTMPREYFIKRCSRCPYFLDPGNGGDFLPNTCFRGPVAPFGHSVRHPVCYSARYSVLYNNPWLIRTPFSGRF